MFGDILQPTHLLLVLGVALLVLGPKRLPDAGRSLGQGLREFKSSLTSPPSEPSAALETVPAVAEETQPRAPSFIAGGPGETPPHQGR